jgi:hypothetical protein
MKRIVVALAPVAAVVVVLVVSFADRVPPRALTATRMQALKRQVLQYAHSHDELPKSLAALPPLDRYDSSYRDGWRRRIAFEVSASGVVSFRSLGRDGVRGGSGEDADIVRSFPARDAQGRWSDEMVAWSQDTLR